MDGLPPRSPLFPYTTLFRSDEAADGNGEHREQRHVAVGGADAEIRVIQDAHGSGEPEHHVERSEEHTSELQSCRDLVCRLALEKRYRAGIDDEGAVLAERSE